MANYTIAAIEFGMITARLKKELCEWEEAEQRYRDIFNLALQAIRGEEELTGDERNIALNSASEAVYNLAFARYIEHDYDEAVGLLTSDMIHLLKGKVLLGLCYYKLGIAKRDAKISTEAGRLLAILEKEERQLYQENIDSMDDNLLGEAYLCLAQNYRFGMGVEKSTEKAYLTIERGLKNVKGDLREMLEEEKARYRKTFFGGWEYR